MARFAPSISNSCFADVPHFASVKCVELAAPPDIEAGSDFENVCGFEAGASHN